MNKILLHKLKEALLAVLPITIIILVLNFAVSPMDSLQLVSFVFGAFLLILGMGLYSLGCDTDRRPYRCKNYGVPQDMAHSDRLSDSGRHRHDR